MEKNTCLYFHISLEKQEIFYVGIGKTKRPYKVKSRSKVWKTYVKKYSNYQIIIIQENLTWNEACELEVKYIAQIGRRDLKLGSLINLTDGGELRAGRNNGMSRAVYQYSIEGKKINQFINLTEATKVTQVPLERILSSANGRYKTGGGFVWRFVKPKKNEPLNTVKSVKQAISSLIRKTKVYKKQKGIRIRPVIQYDLQGNIVAEYNSMKEVKKTKKYNKTKLTNCCKGRTIESNNYIWRYKIPKFNEAPNTLESILENSRLLMNRKK